MWNNLLKNTQSEYQAWLDATTDVKNRQRELLHHILSANKTSEIGDQYSFATIDDYRKYRDRIPIQCYEEFATSIDRMLNGEPNIRTTEAVLMFEMTSGSTGAPKYIPYTSLSLQAFQKAIYAWLADICIHFPRVMNGMAYFAISPAVRNITYTPKGIPIGTQDDSIYFGDVLGQQLQQIMLTSDEIATATDFDAWKHLTAKTLATANNISFISVWSPTYLLEILETIQELYPDFNPQTHWPNLTLVSCWTSASSAYFAEQLKSLIPHASIQGKGLISTEAMVSIPLARTPSPILAVESNFYEFIDDQKNIYLAHELKEGESYDLILTNYSGLYRYATNDRVMVTGYYNQAPQIEFIGKTKNYVDLCGEKLSESFVLSCFKQYNIPIDGKIFLTVTKDPKPGYIVLFETGAYSAMQMSTITVQINHALKQNLHYDYAQNIGQLMPLQFRESRNLLKQFYDTLLNQGKRFGDIKMTPLLPST